MAEPTKTRKPRARHISIIQGAMDERMLMLDAAKDTETCQEHAARIRELCDELRRSIGKDNGGDSE